MFVQVLMVRFCTLFNAQKHTVTFLNGQTYSLATLRAFGMGSLLDAMFEFSEKLGSLGLEPDEMALFMAVVLVSAGKNIDKILREVTLSQCAMTLTLASTLPLRPFWHLRHPCCGAATGGSDPCPALTDNSPSSR